MLAFSLQYWEETSGWEDGFPEGVASIISVLHFLAIAVVSFFPFNCGPLPFFSALRDKQSRNVSVENSGAHALTWLCSRLLLIRITAGLVL